MVANATRNLAIRLTLENGQVTLRGLEDVGEKGGRSFDRLGRSATDADKRLAAFTDGGGKPAGDDISPNLGESRFSESDQSNNSAGFIA